MSGWRAIRRATLLIPSGPTHDPERKHLHIVLNDPHGESGEVLIVSVTSIPLSNLYDPSCSLNPGEHPFIVRDSYVSYRFTRKVQAQALEDQVKQGEFIAKPLMDEKIFKYVIEGFFDSPHVTPKLRRFLEEILK